MRNEAAGCARTLVFFLGTYYSSVTQLLFENDIFMNMYIRCILKMTRVMTSPDVYADRIENEGGDDFAQCVCS